jgi:tetratricopeptide (TPR) repeat protein
LILFAALALAGAAPAQPAAPACAKDESCVTASAAQLFALAGRLYAERDLAGAAHILEALTRDKHAELRAEARFRLAAVREKLGDLAGAAQALRDLLAEQPSANPARLELARILDLMGRDKDARTELARAQAAGLPAEVEQNVRRFASALRRPGKRGLTIEITAGPDSNVNRSTSSPFIDTIIAPFDLDADARRQSAFAYSLSARGFSRDRLGKISWLTNAGLRADLSTKRRFNDVQLALDSGPEANVGKVQLRPAGLVEKRWYGGDSYSTGGGGQLELLAPLAPDTQLGLSGSYVRQDIAKNDGQDGWRTALGADVTHSLGDGITGRASLRYGALDARVRPESLRQLGGGLLLARQTRALTLFAEVDYTRTHGIELLFLFGKTRRDQRWDVVAGAIFNRASVAGFSPLVRLTHSDSSANIALYEYRRTRLDVGLTRNF